MQSGARETPYVETTRSSDYESWPWYQSALEAMKAADDPNWQPVDPLPPDQLLPVDVGQRYCAWVMDTPEIRDIVYRRFVSGDYENKTEEMLLRASTFHFLYQEGYSTRHFAKLSLCWRVVAKIIKNEYSSAESAEVHALLLQYINFFSPIRKYSS